jgi:hypothetical protein
MNLKKKKSSFIFELGVAKKPRSTTGTICKHCLRNHLSKREKVLIKQAPSSMTLGKKSLLYPPTTVPEFNL